MDPLLQQSSHIHYVDDSLEIDEELKLEAYHCTRLSQYQYLKEKMGDRLCYLGSGHTIMIS